MRKNVIPFFKTFENFKRLTLICVECKLYNLYYKYVHMCIKYVNIICRACVTSCVDVNYPGDRSGGHIRELKKAQPADWKSVFLVIISLL